MTGTREASVVLKYHYNHIIIIIIISNLNIITIRSLSWTDGSRAWVITTTAINGLRTDTLATLVLEKNTYLISITWIKDRLIQSTM